MRGPLCTIRHCCLVPYAVTRWASLTMQTLGVVLLANVLSENNKSRLRELIERHIDVSETEEWPAMAAGRAAIATPTALREALKELLAFPTIDETKKTAKAEIIDALRKALD